MADRWDREVAEVYDQSYRAKFEPSVLDPMVGLLVGWPETDVGIEAAYCL